MRPVAIALASIVFALSLHAEEEAPARLPPPDAAALREANKLTREVFKADLAAASSAQEKAKVARNILSASNGEKDPSGRYAMLLLAIDQASDAGDFDLAIQAIGKLERAYEEDVAPRLVQAAADSAKAIKTPGDRDDYYASASKLIDHLLGADAFPVARKIADQTCSAMRGDPALFKQASQMAAEVRELEAASEKLAKSLAAAKSEEEKSTLQGRYLCFYRDNWGEGLKLLATGGDPLLQQLATAETEKDVTPETLAGTAEGWEKYAEKLTGLPSRQVLAHAESLYRTSLPNLGGIAKVKAENRLKSLEAKQAPAISSGTAKVAAARYVGEKSNRTFNDEVPDELTVADDGRSLRISGTKKSDTVSILGQTCGHFGKIAVLTGATRGAGELGAVVGSQGDHTHYAMHLIKADGSVESRALDLKAGAKYTWQAAPDGNDIVLRVMGDKNEIANLRLARGDCRGIGFSATVRHKGDKADLQVKW